MQQAVRKYLKALEAGDADKAGALFVADGWVQSPFLGKIPVREYVKKVADASSSTALTVHDVLVSAEGHMRAVAYYLYDWQLKDGSKAGAGPKILPLAHSAGSWCVYRSRRRRRRLRD